ncbi:hypothetical protein NLJ89_g11530 [Agrocybe chaxingu]|uniref:Uncharacterized protein n=1 Tax=Agrocybe chaxingu TaxID=84603 RepID=A0A9W8MR33_9AGAR|nr:hypothetical protein NLJ89_g11530 [Agrocybe chaxingu]
MLVDLFPRDSRWECDATVVSDYVSELVKAVAKRNREDWKERLYLISAYNTMTKIPAGWILDEGFHWVFLAPSVWRLSPLQASTRRGPKNQHWATPGLVADEKSVRFLYIGSKGFSITRSRTSTSKTTSCDSIPNHRFPPLNKKSGLAYGYHQPALTTQASFDSFLYDPKKKRAVLFQATVGSTHSVKELGITELTAEFGVTVFTYIAVTPPSVTLKISGPHAIDRLLEKKYYQRTEITSQELILVICMQLMGQNYFDPRPLEEAETHMRLQHEQQIWATFWHAPAGDGHPLFQHHIITLETTLADANLDAPSKCWLLRIPEGLRGIFGDTCTSAILFREDYLEALRAAFRAVSWDDAYVGVEHVDSDLSNSKFNNPFLRRQQVSRDWKSSCLVLTGGPGIGKSLWLVTVLILRLHARLPTIYQRQNDRILFFDQDGPAEFRTVVDLFRSAAVRRHQRGELWVLVDTNDELQTVDRCYRFQHAFIIQSIATDVKHTRWMRKLSFLATHFVLQPWSLAELIIGRILHENAPSGGSILEFTQKFGNMPENVYKYADAQEEYEAQVLARVSFPPPYPESTSFDKIAFDYPEFIALRPTSSQPWYYAPHFVSKHVVHFLFLSSDTAPRARIPSHTPLVPAVSALDTRSERAEKLSRRESVGVVPTGWLFFGRSPQPQRHATSEAFGR